VITGGNSAVISAACHAVSSRADSLMSLTAARRLSTVVTDPSDYDLRAMVTGPLKWGDLFSGPSDGEPGHLGFGSADQDVSEPIEGRWYGGYQIWMSTNGGKTGTPTRDGRDLLESHDCAEQAGH
jgi:hypothetical protein